MRIPQFFLTTIVVPSLFVGSASAVTLASTSFDGRVLSPNNTATALNWVLNGLEDPGNMAALNAAAAPQPIFDGAFVANMFAPGLNTGNGNTFWTTSVALTVSSGSNVTLTDVTFDYWSINGGQAQNVNRQSDFTITLLDPSAMSVGAVDIVDSISGTGAGVPLVTATFTSPIALTAPGTYTLVIKGGDFAGNDETGNHTAIDNLSIIGTVSAVPEPSSALLAGLGLLAMLRRQRK